MHIWKYHEDVGAFSALQILNKQDREFVMDIFTGKLPSASWRPVPVDYIEDDDKARGDFPCLSGLYPVFRRHSLDIMADLIAADADFLPLQCEGEELFLINVTAVIDCLDSEKSDIRRSTRGIILRILDYAFDVNCVAEHHIFKVPEQSVTVFVSDTFKERVERHQLKGLALRHLYSAP